MKQVKRQLIPKSWPIPRKGNTFVVGAGKNEIPLLIILRDMLNITKTKREVNKLCLNKSIK